jgi:hypothetical protein
MPCGMIFGVEKAELIIESEPNDEFVKGRCSVCPAVRFAVTGNTLKQKQLVRTMFDLHVKRAHLRDEVVIPGKA